MEIISHFPDKRNSHPPLLFVHGAFCGAWVWEEHFMPYFAENGFESHAMNLRGHGDNGKQGYMHHIGLADYVEDLHDAVAHLDTAPILIGHSLGGVVVQKWLKNNDAAAAVLMGSGPPHGMLPSSIGMMWRDPLLVSQLALAQIFGPGVSLADTARKALFSDSLPADVVKRHFSRGSAESLRVGFELIWPDFPIPEWNREIPVFVLGAENDFFISPVIVRATANVYKTRAVIIPDMAHAMMLEPNWHVVADHVLAWLHDSVSSAR